jgi:hypothetical protein
MELKIKWVSLYVVVIIVFVLVPEKSLSNAIMPYWLSGFLLGVFLMLYCQAGYSTDKKILNKED